MFRGAGVIHFYVAVVSSIYFVLVSGDWMGLRKHSRGTRFSLHRTNDNRLCVVFFLMKPNSRKTCANENEWILINGWMEKRATRQKNYEISETKAEWKETTRKCVFWDITAPYCAVVFNGRNGQKKCTSHPYSVTLTQEQLHNKKQRQAFYLSDAVVCE